MCDNQLLNKNVLEYVHLHFSLALAFRSDIAPLGDNKISFANDFIYTTIIMNCEIKKLTR